MTYGNLKLRMKQMFVFLNSNIVVALVVAGTLVYASRSFREINHRGSPQVTKIHASLPALARVKNNLGSLAGKVVVIEYADNQCPACGAAHKTIDPFVQRLASEGKIRFIARDFPLAMHVNAEKSAEAARCAGEQGKFWELRCAMREHQKDLSLNGISLLAEGVGVDARRLSQCVATGKYTVAVKEDLDEGLALGVHSTPSFVVGRLNGDKFDGELFVGGSLMLLKAAIEREK